MVVTLLTSQADTSLLKDVAPSNILPMIVTLLTSQADTSLLKDDAPANMLAMVVAELVFQDAISSSKVLDV